MLREVGCLYNRCWRGDRPDVDSGDLFGDLRICTDRIELQKEFKAQITRRDFWRSHKGGALVEEMMDWEFARIGRKIDSIGIMIEKEFHQIKVDLRSCLESQMKASFATKID